MNITIDAGNTFIKVALFRESKLVSFLTMKDRKEVFELVGSLPGANLIVSSVNNEWTDEAAVKNNLPQNFRRILFLNSMTPVPLVNRYSTPATLGMDRLAAVAGAQTLFPGKACLVIDAGSCITYDYADAEKNYHGGSISPGMTIRFRSLHSFTARLPLLERDQITREVDLTGKDTRESILSGVINGIAAEMNGIIVEYLKNVADLHVLICGGDANFFETKIKQSIFVVPELVHWGLNRILEHNESEP
jgi:type III pantothenate kinase